MDQDRGGTVTIDEFVNHMTRRWGFKADEALRTFTDVDVDHSGTVSRMELLAAVGLAEASIMFEDLRTKVRQRSKSITEAFLAFLEDELQSIFDAPAVTLKVFQDLLVPLGLKESDVALLFQLMDTDRTGELSFGEFV